MYGTSLTERQDKLWLCSSSWHGHNMKSVCAQNHRTSPKFDRDKNLDDSTW